MDAEKYLALVVGWFNNYSPRIFAALAIFIIGKWLARKLSRLLIRLLKKYEVGDITLVGFLSNIVYYSLLVMVIIAAAGQLGVNTTAFLTIVGAAGLAIGLALKDSLANFAAGVLLIMFHPFKVGDFVNAGGVDGTVVQISIFNTILNSPDNRRVFVPNGKIINDVITNVSTNPTRRVDLVIGISYDDDIARAKEIIGDILKSDQRILGAPLPKIGVAELADSSVNLIVRPWVNTTDYWDTYLDLTEKIKTTFDEQGITIPFPQRDVHLDKNPAQQ